MKKVNVTMFVAKKARSNIPIFMRFHSVLLHKKARSNLPIFMKFHSVLLHSQADTINMINLTLFLNQSEILKINEKFMGMSLK